MAYPYCAQETIISATPYGGVQETVVSATPYGGVQETVITQPGMPGMVGMPGAVRVLDGFSTTTSVTSIVINLNHE
jgi:hypothetical protein